MKQIMKILLCKILTLGFHWWTYGTHPRTKRGGCVYCSLCHKIADSQWEIYKKKFLGKPKGTYKVPTNTNQIFRGRKDVATRKK